MKLTTLISAVAAVAFSVALPACAGDSNAMYGRAGPVESGNRQISITPDTRYVNVTHGEVVTFVVGDKRFAWNFNGPRTNDAIDLQQVAPDGILNHPVRAYVRADPQIDGA